MTAIKGRIGAVFVPVADIERAKAWYARLLGLPSLPETVYGHLAVFPAADRDTRLVLDAKIFVPGLTRDTPLFHFGTDDLDEAYQHVIALGGQIVTPPQSEHWFTFRDPDGNVVMVCR